MRSQSRDEKNPQRAYQFLKPSVRENQVLYTDSRKNIYDFQGSVSELFPWIQIHIRIFLPGSGYILNATDPTPLVILNAQ